MWGGKRLNSGRKPRTVDACVSTPISIRPSLVEKINATRGEQSWSARACELIRLGLEKEEEVYTGDNLK